MRAAGEGSGQRGEADALSKSNTGEVDRALTLLDEAVAAVAGLGVHPLELAALTIEDVDLSADTLAVGARTLALDRPARDALLLWVYAGRVALLEHSRPDKDWDRAASTARRWVYVETGTDGLYQRIEQPLPMFYGVEGEALTPDAAAEIARRYAVELAAPQPLRAVS